MITQEAVIQKLQHIYDPEIPVNIYDLGLIYDIKIIDNDIYILMTLTTATCPAAAFIPESVRNELRMIWGVKSVHVDVVYEPRWSKNKMSPKAKKVLGFA